MPNGLLSLSPDAVASIARWLEFLDEWHDLALTCKYLSQCFRSLFDKSPKAWLKALRLVRRWQKWQMPVLSILDLGTEPFAVARHIRTSNGRFKETVFSRTDASEVTWNPRTNSESFCNAIFGHVNHSVVFEDLIESGSEAPEVSLDMSRLSAMQAFATMVEEDVLLAMRRALRARVFRAGSKDVEDGELSVDACDLEFAIALLHMPEHDQYSCWTDTCATVVNRAHGKIHLMNLGFMQANVNQYWLRRSGYADWGVYDLHPLSLESELSIVSALAHRAGIPRFTCEFTKLAWQYVIARAVSLLARTLVIMAGAVVPSGESESESDESDESESGGSESDESESGGSESGGSDESESFDETLTMCQFDPTQSADENMVNSLLEAEFHSEFDVPPHQRTERGVTFSPTEEDFACAVAGLRKMC